VTFGGLTVNGEHGAKLINDQSDTLNGVHSLITPDVLGIGSISISNAQGVGGFLEFGRSVSSGQDVSVSGDPGRGLACSLKIFLTQSGLTGPRIDSTTLPLHV
jgi:hypothetical protein